MLCRYLEGENVKPRTKKEAEKLIGKKVQYLRGCDIDRSGRGLCFPRINIVQEIQGKNLMFEDLDSVFFSDISEMIILG